MMDEMMNSMAIDRGRGYGQYAEQRRKQMSAVVKIEVFEIMKFVYL